MVRHSFFREAPEQVDLQVNLLPKGDRAVSSHELAVRLRPGLDRIVAPARARLKIVEIPPGPPVLDTLVAEVYGPPRRSGPRIAGEVRAAFDSIPGIVDVDSTQNPTAPETVLTLDREKAALHGVKPADVVQTLALAGHGAEVGASRLDRGTRRVPLVLQLPAGQRRGSTRSVAHRPRREGTGPARRARARRGLPAGAEIHHKT